MARKVVVTGGAGFLGRELCGRLLADGHQVSVVDAERPGDLELEGALLLNSDIRDRAAVRSAVDGADTVFHLVAVQPVSRSSRKVFWEINVGGTRNLLQAALDSGVRRVVYVSSSAVYGVPREAPVTERTRFAPVCDYGRSKIAAELVCRLYRGMDLDVVILRPRVLIGPGRLGIYHTLFDWIADGKRIYLIGSGCNPFQALSCADMVEACVLSMNADCRDEEVNLGAERFGTMVGDLQALTAHAGTGSTLVKIPAAPTKTILRFLDRTGLSPLTRWHYETFDVPFHFDVSKAKELLGWAPRQGNVDMLIESYDWYVSHRLTVDQDLGTTHRRSLRQRAFRLLKAVS